MTNLLFYLSIAFVAFAMLAVGVARLFEMSLDYAAQHERKPTPDDVQ